MSCVLSPKFLDIKESRVAISLFRLLNNLLAKTPVFVNASKPISGLSTASLAMDKTFKNPEQTLCWYEFLYLMQLATFHIYHLQLQIFFH